jgi:lipopolysaccharide export system protein LptA
MEPMSLRGVSATKQSRKRLDGFAMLAMTVFVCISATAYAAANPLASGKYNTSGPIEINADTLEVFQEENRAVFSGHVVAIQDKVRLKSDKMNVFYSEPSADKKEAGDQGAIKKIEVEGSVFLSTPEETASGTTGLYDVAGQKIFLNNNVVLTRGKNVLKGDKLVYNFATGVSTVNGGGVDQATGGKQRVRALFTPEKNNEKK